MLGRDIVGNADYMLSEVCAKKKVVDNHFILLDAGFNDLVRPVMYGGYHDLAIISWLNRRPGEAAAAFWSPKFPALDVRKDLAP